MSTDPNAPVETDPETPSGSTESSTPASDAVEPAPQSPEIPPYETDEFKKKVAEAGFPGSPQTDPAWLAALYRFSGAGTETGYAEPAAPPSEPAPEPETQPAS